jgi:hypothetical protein
VKFTIVGELGTAIRVESETPIASVLIEEARRRLRSVGTDDDGRLRLRRRHHRHGLRRTTAASNVNR